MKLKKTSKKTLRKSAQFPLKALLEFLRQYRSTRTNSGFFPSQQLNGKQIGTTKLDALFPSPAHIMQSIQTRSTSSNDNSHSPVHNFIVDDLCYTLCFGPKQTRDPRWVPAVIIKRTDTRNIQVRTVPQDSIWRRHIDQLRLRYS